MTSPEQITIVGAGLGGALLATLLGQSGREVDLYEMRSDPRRGAASGGRSINLAISTRGLHALDRAGLADEVRAMAVPMRGRMIHARSGRLTFLRYGTRPDQYLNSVSRLGLNIALLDRADRLPNVRLRFGTKCTGVGVDGGGATFRDAATGEEVTAAAGAIIGADGAFSAVRRHMGRIDLFDYQQSYLSHGYKELTIPPGRDGGFAMEPNALHIWPRGGFMMIALPNADRTFTCTLFWPLAASGRLRGLETRRQIAGLFEREFPDAVGLIPDLGGEFFRNPTGSLVTIRCRPWHFGDRVALLGDACHAVVPFFGQGANAAFEDCVALSECLDRHRGDRAAAFAEYESLRRVHTDALADLSIANFLEMRDRTRSRLFRWRRGLERGLHRLLPGLFIPLYTLVTFTRVPYAEAVRQARRQEQWLEAAAYLFFVVFSVLLLVWILL
jgi:kynurenine 3-monooxygenase